MVLYYHYTTELIINDINTTKVIKATELYNTDGTEGGVYLTTLSPEAGKELITHSNWGKRIWSLTNFDHFIMMDIPESHPNILAGKEEEILKDLYFHKGDMNLDEFPGWKISKVRNSFSMSELKTELTMMSQAMDLESIKKTSSSPMKKRLDSKENKHHMKPKLMGIPARYNKKSLSSRLQNITSRKGNILPALDTIANEVNLILHKKDPTYINSLKEIGSSNYAPITPCAFYNGGGCYKSRSHFDHRTNQYWMHVCAVCAKIKLHNLHPANRCPMLLKADLLGMEKEAIKVTEIELD